MILLIDGNNLAITANSIGSASTRDGFPTQAISGSLRNIRAYIKAFSPKKIFIAWDGGKSKKRVALHPGYKANRAVDKKTPEQKMNFDEFLMQAPFIKQAAADLGLYTLSGPGIEGDDLIALMAKKLDEMREDTIIVSSDSDFHQLISRHVSVYATTVQQKKSKKPRHITFDNFEEAYGGLTPSQFLEFKALKGDTADDIPGVKGVGEVHAKKLLLEFGSVEGWAQEVQERKTKLGLIQKKILDNWADYQLSKAMIDLHNPLADFSTAKIEPGKPDYAAVRLLALNMQITDIFKDFSTWIQPFKELR